MDDRIGRLTLIFGTVVNLLLCGADLMDMGVIGNRLPLGGIYASLLRFLA